MLYGILVHSTRAGSYGNPDSVKSVSETVENSRLFYGGGINCAAKAAEMGKYADTIVVGNAVYEEGAAALKETIKAVK